MGLFLASLSFLGLFITILSNASTYAKSGLILFFFALIIMGVLLETPLFSRYFKERFEG